MFVRAVQTAVPQRVMMASKKPQAQPANNELQVHSNRNCPDPTEENIFWNPMLINQARPKPTNEPTTQDKLATIAPSMTARERASDCDIPRDLNVPNSPRLASASMSTMVNTRRTPAAMVNEPKTRNMAARTPEDSEANAAASTFTGRTARFKSSASARSSNQLRTLSRATTSLS